MNCMQSVKIKFIKRMLFFIVLPALLSGGAILIMLWNYASWWDCSHYDCMLSELQLCRMNVISNECIIRRREDFVFIVNADSSVIWQLSTSKVSVDDLLNFCFEEENNQSRMFFLVDKRIPEIEVAKLLQRVSDIIGDRVYVVGLCEGRIIDKIGFSMLCPRGMSCHACCWACVKWHGFPLDVNSAKRVIAYLPEGVRADSGGCP